MADYEVGSIYAKVTADTSSFTRGLAEAKVEADAFAHSVDDTSRSTDGLTRSIDENTGALSRGQPWWKSLLTNWRVLVPAGIGLGTAILGMTGNFGMLGAVIPIVTTGLGLLLTPFTTLLAVIVALAGPLAMLGVLAGGLAAAFGFTFMREAGNKTSFLYERVQQLRGEFNHLIGDLTMRFMPVFMQVVHAVSEAITYFDHLSHMSLADAFKSISTTGVAMFQKLLEGIGHVIANPIRLAFAFAFGTGGANAQSALGSLFDQVKHFFTTAPKGQISIAQMIGNWFNAQDFSKTGERWGQELAGAVMSAFGRAIKNLLGTRGGLLIGGGGLVGAIVGLFTPLGPALGAAIGAGLGALTNHYFPQIKKGVVEIADKLKQWWDELNRNKQMSELIKVTWSNLKSIATDFRSIGLSIFKIIDDIFIKTGAWKLVVAVIVGLVAALVGGIRAVLDVISSVLRVIKDVVAWLSNARSNVAKLAGIVGGALLGAFNAVVGVVESIVGGIQSAIGAAQSLASALGGVLPSGSQSTGASNRRLHAQQNGGGGRAIGAGASGGLVTRPTLSLIGESGPEMVVPLSQMRGASALPAFGGGGNTHVHLTVHGFVGNEMQLVRAIRDAMVQDARRGTFRNGYFGGLA